ncbi:MAG: methyltransferase [Clostridia bacterium]|nr:methyltransferase [Clostridia bacterium]
MTGRQRVIKALDHEPVDRLPRDVWTVPYIDMFRSGDLRRVLDMYPSDISTPGGFRYGSSRLAKGVPCRVGRYTDEFGCGWEVLEDGVIGEVKDPIIRSGADLDGYRLPWELLDEAVTAGQLDTYNQTDAFVLMGTYVRPFERMQFLRGTEQLYIDLATEDPIFLRLKEMLHAFNLRNIKLAASQAVDGVGFMDDWGTQRALLISPAAWRKHFKPMYREYCDILHKAGKRAFFHSDGHTEAIYGDLVEIGVDAYNSQLFCMDIEGIAARYAGKITFWGELDRQYTLPFGAEEDVRADVRRLGAAMLAGKRSGLIAQLSFETLTPLSNVLAAYDEFARL